MRIARVLCEDPEETAPAVRLALERDDALYDVAELDRAFDTPFSPDRFPRADDFHTRAITLRCAGLDALDDRLRRGDRPTETRLLPGQFTWLPPCDTERALLVHLGARPSFRVGNARALVGHGARVVFPIDETRPAFEPSIAAVLGDDLDAATEADARGAILGYTILNGWRGRDEAERDPAATALVPSQLGPVLVTADEIGDLASLRAEARVGGGAASTMGGAPLGRPAASIAWLSRWTPLRAGDVIGFAPLPSAGEVTASWDSPIELRVERLGKLAGKPVR